MITDESRKHSRTEFELECYVRVYSNTIYKALLVDLSLSGVRLLVDDVTPFVVGDSCEFMLRAKTESDYRKHFCDVIRVESGNIGLKFRV